ncbi:mechanosensitive ion channel [Lederbergia lenta]|uniref:Putative integral inner membrane protein n=1 Tax=Lederbergia lenta TaxID=1467 RepID=A0A2X4WTK2_LEDLE|nr:mechanosensitive ion channel [Lederbergia lenta]MEC2323196.1 mechanosensitive ion channel [Lederbergia lenta]SQI62968.1 putative integral inner membrane protein [Lederbergia lenta]
MPFSDFGWASMYISKLPSLLWALIVLVIGWIIAKAVGKAVEKLLRKTKWDEKLFGGRHHSTNAQAKDGASPKGKSLDTNELIGKIIYYILLVFVFILFFQLINLGAIASPFLGMFGTLLGFIPAVLKAGLILLLAYAIASLLKMLIIKGGKKAHFQTYLEKMKVADSGAEGEKFLQTAGNIVFYLVMLLFIPGVLSALSINGVAGPFGNMLDNVLAFIPKLLAAALILFVGWFVAKIIRDLVTGLLKTVGIEKFAQRLGLQKMLGDSTLSSIIGTIVFVLIMIPIVISAIDQLQIRAITDPAVSMLNDIMTMIPNIIIAVLLIFLSVWLGKWARQLIAGFLQRVGFDSMTRNISLGNWKPGAGGMLMSEVVGYIAQILIIFFLTIEALRLVKLDFLVGMLTAITAYLPNVLAAVIILALGLIIANIVEKVLSSILTGPSFKLITAVAKYAIIALSLFMALDQLGVAATIVNSAFILILGGLALAFGLAFGLGGKEFAKNYLAKLDKTIEQTDVDTSKKPKVANDEKDSNNNGPEGLLPPPPNK